MIKMRILPAIALAGIVIFIAGILIVIGIMVLLMRAFNKERFSDIPPLNYFITDLPKYSFYDPKVGYMSGDYPIERKHRQFPNIYEQDDYVQYDVHGTHLE